jgi:glycosyltransferase involved in cell wall biosynthesis
MIVGEGPEADPLRKLANSLGIQDRTKFLGSKRGAELAGLMNQHKVLVVPSRSQPPEALSVVVIEGIACGCIPVASRQGGLPDAVGEVGVLFEEGNVDELAEILLRLLDAPELSDFYGAKIELHLRQFSPETVADAYESHFMACNRP